MSCSRYLPTDTEAVAAALLWTPEHGVLRHARQIRRVEFMTGREIGDVPYRELFDILARFLDYLNAQAYADRYGEPLELAFSNEFKPRPIEYGLQAAKRCLQNFAQGGGWTYQATDCHSDRDSVKVERVTDALHSLAWTILQAEAVEEAAKEWEARASR
jgi:hypothetical protein